MDICQIEPRNVYGNTLNYPVNETAKHFCMLTGTITLKREHLKYIVKLGFAVQALPKQLELEEIN